MADIEMLSVVALLEELPQEGLVRGQVGTVVESRAPGVYEVEFCDANGRTYAMVALKADHEVTPRAYSRGCLAPAPAAPAQRKTA